MRTSLKKIIESPASLEIAHSNTPFIARQASKRPHTPGITETRIGFLTRSLRQDIPDLRTSEMRFRSLFEQNHDAIYFLDLEGNYLDSNQRGVEMLGYSVEENRLRTMHQNSAEPEKLIEMLALLIRGEIVPIFEIKLRRKNGEIIHTEVNAGLVKDNHCNPIHIQVIVRDITRRKQAEEELQKANAQLNIQLELVNALQDMLREQAMRDHLTGLHNRRYLDETLPREIIRANRENTSVSIIISDIDFFKDVNDQYGHAAGDAVLLEIARIFSGSVRGSDIICRYGGEEFLLVLPGMPLEQAVQRAEHLRKTCAKTLFNYLDKQIRLTLSFGVATYPQHGTQAEEVLLNADKALYLSKQSGRNRVSLWE